MTTTTPHLTFGDETEETFELAGLIPVAGPPLFLLAGPWLFFCLMLTGPFAVLVTLVLVFAAAAGVVALCCAILASPFLLVRRLGRSRAARAHAAQPAPWDAPQRRELRHLQHQEGTS